MVLNRDIKQNFDVFEPETNLANTFPLNLVVFNCTVIDYAKLFVVTLHFVHEYVTSFRVQRDKNADVISAW